MKHVFRNGVCKHCSMTTAELFVLKQIICPALEEESKREQQEIADALGEMFGGGKAIIATSMADAFEQISKLINDAHSKVDAVHELFDNPNSPDSQRDAAFLAAINESPLPRSATLKNFPVHMEESLLRLIKGSFVRLTPSLTGSKYVITDLGRERLDLINAGASVPEDKPETVLRGELLSTFVRHAWNPGQSYSSVSIRESRTIEELNTIGLLELVPFRDDHNIRVTPVGAAFFEKLLSVPIL